MKQYGLSQAFSLSEEMTLLTRGDVLGWVISGLHPVVFYRTYRLKACHIKAWGTAPSILTNPHWQAEGLRESWFRY